MARLFESEILRFRSLALVLGSAHFFALVIVATSADLFSPDVTKTAVALFVYSVVGLALGLYQLGTQRKLNRWTFLVHRPLAPQRIFLAVTGAAVALLFLVVALPLFLMAFLTDFLTSQWLDSRHYFLPIFALGVSLIHYFAGVYMTLSAHRTAVLVLVLSSFVFTREAVGSWIFVPMIVVLAWLGFLAFTVFKPDLSTHPKSGPAIAAAALPIQYAFLLLMVLGVNFGYSFYVAFQEAGWKSFSVFAWNDYFPEGTFDHTAYLDGLETLSHGLDLETSDRAGLLKRQLELAEIAEVYRRFNSFPVKDQPMFMDRYSQLVDSENEVLWTYSHDLRLFHGRDQRTGEVVGWLGIGGLMTEVVEKAATDHRFSEIPYVIGHQLVTHDRVFEFDPIRQEIFLRFVVPEGESIVTEMREFGDQMTVLSDRALYLFNRRDLDWALGEVQPAARVLIPIGIEDLSRVHLAELLDGTVVGFLYGTRSARGFGEGLQVVGELTPDGAFEVVAERPLGQGMPTWFRFRGLILSPGLQVAHDIVWSWIGPYRDKRVDLSDYRSRVLPTGVLTAVLLSALLAVMAMVWATGRRELRAYQRPLWILAALLIGWPAVLSVFFLTTRWERFQAGFLRQSSIGWVESAA